MHWAGVVQVWLSRILTFALLAAFTPAAVAQTPNPIRLKSRTFVPTANVHTAGPARRAAPGTASSAAGYVDATRRHLIIQFTGPITPADLADLRRAGAVPLRSVPEHALAVAAGPEFDPSVLPRARWTGTLTPADKLSAHSSADLARSNPAYPLTVIEFHPDVTAAQVAASLAVAGTAAIPGPPLPAHVVLVPTDRDAIERLVSDDGVAWVYPATTSALTENGLLCQGLAGADGAVAEYATIGDGWDGPGLGSANLSYFVQTPTRDVTPFLTSVEVSRALAEWSRHIAVRWRPAALSGETRSLTVQWAPTDHGDGYPFAPEILAHAFYQAPLAPETIAGDIHFNENFDWGVSDPSRYDIFTVMLHEAGHSLGLTHSSDPSAVMYPMYAGIVSGLAEADIQSARQLYAPSAPSVPAGWAANAIGPGVSGTVVGRDDSFTLEATGRDIWGTADELRFASHALDGDGDIVARVDSIAGVHRWTKAGVMIRASVAPGSPHAFMLVSAQRGLAFQRRHVAGGLSTSSDPIPGAAPQWLWLSRRGNRFEAYAATGGGQWRMVGADNIAMGRGVLAGLALTSHEPAAVATAMFSRVSITHSAAWTGTDVGATGQRGTLAVIDSQLRVSGAGADVWGTADAFHYAWKPLQGDGEIVARVASLQNTSRWAKAGVMIRENLDPGSPHAFMLTSPGKGHAFQRRRSSGNISVHTSGGAGTAPQWVRLRREGNLLTASRSADGITWTTVGRDTIVMGQNVLVGLAVSSHTTAKCLAVFDSVSVRPLPFRD